MEDKTKTERAVKTPRPPKNNSTCTKPSRCCEEGNCSLPKDNKCPDPN